MFQKIVDLIDLKGYTMKMNIEIDETQIKKIRAFQKDIGSIEDIIDLALTEYLKSLHRDNLIQLRGKVEWEGNLDDMRTQDITEF
jgi:hypothetical protein